MTSTSESVAGGVVRRVEVAIVGGGPAGLSAALVLGRARRSVLVIDAGTPGHFAADAVHGFLGQENVPPRELRRRVWEQLAPFDVELVEGEVVGGRAVGAAGLSDVGGGGGGVRGAVDIDSGFVLTLADGSSVEAPAVLLAGGVRYGVRDLPGLESLWGTHLFHCPFCHGWEVRGKRVGVVAPPPALGHLRPLLALWADDLTAFSSVEGEGLDVPVATGVRLEGDEVVLQTTDGAEHRFDALFSPPVLSAVGDLPEQLGVERIETSFSPDPIALAVDAWGATSVAGVFAGGDLTGELPTVASAVQGGSRAGAGIVRMFAGQ